MRARYNLHTHILQLLYLRVCREAKKTCTQLTIHTWAASPIYDKKMVSTPGRSQSYECFVGVPIRVLLPAVEPTNPSSYQPGLYDNRAARRFVLFRSRPQTREAPTPSGGQDGLPATAWNSIMSLKQWGVSVLRLFERVKTPLVSEKYRAHRIHDPHTHLRAHALPCNTHDI